MARKPVDVLAKAPKPTGRAAIWAAIRKLAGTCGSEKVFSAADIRRETDINSRTVKGYLDCLIAAGIIAHIKGTHPPLYVMTKDPGAEAPRVRGDGTEVTQGRPTEALWSTIRTTGGLFTINEIALYSSTEEIPVSPVLAKDYLKFMKKAGYVRMDDRHKPARYSFVKSKDPGPKAPQIQRVKRVFDPNSNTVVWPRETADG